MENQVERGSEKITFTHQQFEELLKRLPAQQIKTETGYTTDEEIDRNFAGATDHITPDSKDYLESFNLKSKAEMILPNGQTSPITNIGPCSFQIAFACTMLSVFPHLSTNLSQYPNLLKPFTV